MSSGNSSNGSYLVGIWIYNWWFIICGIVRDFWRFRRKSRKSSFLTILSARHHKFSQICHYDVISTLLFHVATSAIKESQTWCYILGLNVYQDPPTTLSHPLRPKIFTHKHTIKGVFESRYSFCFLFYFSCSHRCTPYRVHHNRVNHNSTFANWATPQDPTR